MCSTKLPTAFIALPAVLVRLLPGFERIAITLAVAPNAAPAIMETIIVLPFFIVINPFIELLLVC